ncbi:MAG: N-acetylmuramoyl-L-alanine amidase [Bacteroidetes bacterium]|nr:MAG: N-acetylmuramoyl-L-alanine amidase [Bacteroidota bacterium]
MNLKLQKTTPFIFTLVLLLVALTGSAQRMTTEEYINHYKDVAIKKMKEFKIPASITLAQGILESGSGNSRLARKANNHFGIKCHKDWHGKKFYMDDDEKHECFRKYPKAADSYRDHSRFLTQRERYTFLFQYDITDYKKWAYGLKKAGYATNPRYPQLLIKIIEKYHLNQYDKEKFGKQKKKKVKTHKEGAIPTIATFKHGGNSPTGRKLFINNKRKLIVARQGDTYEKIAAEFEIYSWQLYKYNEVSRKHKIVAGELIYLEKKKARADKKYKYHHVREGESLHDIAQLYGMRMSKLLKINNLPKGISVPVGTEIRVR